MFQTPERGTRVSRLDIMLSEVTCVTGFKPLNGEPGCRDWGGTSRSRPSSTVSNP